MAQAAVQKVLSRVDETVGHVTVLQRDGRTWHRRRKSAAILPDALIDLGR